MKGLSRAKKIVLFVIIAIALSYGMAYAGMTEPFVGMGTIVQYALQISMLILASIIVEVIDRLFFRNG